MSYELDEPVDDELPPPPIPRRGPCGICGWHPDQRHQILDAIVGRLLAGEDLDGVCEDYEWTADQIWALYMDVTTNLAEMAAGAPHQESEAQVMHIADYTALQHPHYTKGDEPQPLWFVHIGDEVAGLDDSMPSLGTVVAIYLDGMVELSTGDQVAAADLVLLRRAEQ